MFKNFDGQVKVKPLVSLRGASKKEERDALIRKNLQERQQRELWRRQTNAAIKIQSFYRACKVRSIEKAKCRIEFDQHASSVASRAVDIPALTAQFNFFFNKNLDNDRFLFLCKHILKLSPGDIIGRWGHHPAAFVLDIARLTINCCRLLEHVLLAVGQIGTHLRFLQMFMTPPVYNSIQRADCAVTVFGYVFNGGYLRYMKVLLEKRTPSSLEVSSLPPTPLAGATKTLIAEPLISLLSQTNQMHSVSAMSCFLRDLIMDDMSPQMTNYMVPALAREIPCDMFVEALYVWTVSRVTHNASSDDGHDLWVVYMLLNAVTTQQDQLTGSVLEKYLFILRHLVVYATFHEVMPKLAEKDDSADSDSDSDDDAMSDVIEDPAMARRNHFRDHCLHLLTSPSHVRMIVSSLHSSGSNVNLKNVQNLSSVFLVLLTDDRIHVHRMRLLYTLSFDAVFLRCLWEAIQQIVSTSQSRSGASLLMAICSGSLHADDRDDIMPVYSVFACLFRHALFSLHDVDFMGNVEIDASSRDTSVPFTLSELVRMSKLLVDSIIGLLTQTYPESRPRVFSSRHSRVGIPSSDQNDITFLCQNITLLVRQIYSRDCRRHFCPPGHWLSSKALINPDQFDVKSFFDDDENGAIGKHSPSMLSQKIAIVKHIPFSVQFQQRVRVFQRILEHDKATTQNRLQHFFPENSFSITVNRKYLYQDAFDQLSRHQVPDVKKVIRVKMINAQGLDEAGIDGGGLFREFLGQLLKQAFDPSYGFFKITPEQLLYPNPQVEKIFPNYTEHFHFLGRMLGKAIYENMLVELPFAGFFLCKLLRKSNSDVDIHHLELLDPELYKNLLYLRGYTGDIEDLCLNFTVMNSDLGETEVIELKEGGKDVVVTSGNKLEYIHLMADYRLNKQIRPHCNAFRAGLADVISLDWLQMFDHNELQVMISGASNPVDLADLRSHTTYSGGYKDNQQYIDAFWEILDETDDSQRRKFLKFVTSCSRPPLLGFKELWPAFCIHFGGKEDRLPSASTCMNLLKLPEYQSRNLLRTRLMYAIESEAGFELS